LRTKGRRPQLPAHPILINDSITLDVTCLELAPVIITGSHGGLAAAAFAVRKNLKGAIFNDAGVGKKRAGIAGLDLLQKHGILGACVDFRTARIGLGKETAAGLISFANPLAQEAGVEAGQKAGLAAKLMARADWVFAAAKDLPLPHEVETVVYVSPGGRRIVTLDSNSMIRPEHKDAVVLTGSHGGLVGKLPAVKHRVLAAFYNDAGVGKDNASIARLPWLERHGIIGAAVSADTARIGVGLDTYQSGVVSFVNKLGLAMGVKDGMTARQAAHLILEKI
jgi:hypothetical protein